MPTNPADRLAEIRRLCRDPETTGFWVDAMEFVLGMLDQQAAELRTLQQQALAVVEKWRLFQDSPTENVDCAECPHLCACLAELRLLAALSAEREPEKPATLPSKD